jgi:hypothetical protein
MRWPAWKVRAWAEMATSVAIIEFFLLVWPA